jgi:hypothetical protein
LKDKLSTPDFILGIRDDVIEARHYFEVYRTYMLKENREKYSEILLVFGQFFACDLRAHFAATMVTLGRVFDQNPRSFGIPALLQRAPKLKQVASDKFDRAQELWNGRKIMLIRHQVVAHRSPSATVEEIFTKVSTSLNELDELIKSLDEMIDAWARAAKCHSHNLSSVKPDLEHLLNMLLRSRDDRRIASQRTG